MFFSWPFLSFILPLFEQKWHILLPLLMKVIPNYCFVLELLEIADKRPYKKVMVEKKHCFIKIALTLEANMKFRFPWIFRISFNLLP